MSQTRLVATSFLSHLWDNYYQIIQQDWAAFKEFPVVTRNHHFNCKACGLIVQEESSESEVETITHGHKHKQKVALIC